MAPEPSGILPVMGEFLFGRGCLGTGVPIFSAWGAAALAPAQSWSPGTIWGARWRSSYHAAGSREALGGAGVRPMWGSRAALPRLQVLGPPAPLKVQTDGMRAFLPEAPAGRSPSRSPGLLRPHTMHPAHVGLVCRPWDKKYWPSETLWPLGRSGQGLKPLKKMAAERTDV